MTAASAVSILAPAVQAQNSTTAGRKLILAYRIGVGQWGPGPQFRRLLDLLAENRQGVDEISLFDEDFPRPAAVPLETLAPIYDAMAGRIKQLREAGFRAGINVICTLGHQNVTGVPLPKLPVQPMVGHDGKVSNACVCPNSTEFHAYIKERYRLAARAKPDFVWVDDDFRSSHHGVLYPCFCPICMKKFGRERTREALVAKLNAPANIELRRAWTEFCAASLESVAADIGGAVRQVDPAIEVGLMTIGYSHSTYGGYAFPRWMKAMGARRGRPGHGFYTDDAPRTILSKTFDVGREVRDYPPAVTTVEYELENFPYIELDKAAQTVLNESTLAIMMGCTGVAFNALKERIGTLEDYQPLMRAIRAERPVWEGLLKAAPGLPLAGFWPADTPMLMTNRTVGAAGWFREGREHNIQRPNQLAEIGLPLTPDRRSACGVILAGKVAEAFSDEELKSMLAGAVLMDGDALEVLWARGLGELTGVKPGDKYPEAVTETFTDHKLNGADRGDGREAMVQPADNVRSLLPLAPQVESLSSLVRYDGKECGSCLSIFTNRLNGRVAVASYAPWRQLGRGAKRRQMLALADWLCSGRLPVVIEQTARIAPFVRMSPDGKHIAVVLFNLALDPSGPLMLRLRAQPRQVFLLTAEAWKPLSARQTGEGTTLEIPSIPAWQTAVLVSASI